MRFILASISVLASFSIPFAQVAFIPELQSALTPLTQVPVIVLFIWAFMKLEDRRVEIDKQNNEILVSIIEQQHTMIDRLTRVE